MFIRELYASMLAKSGLKVLSAEDGEEGLLMANKLPDLVLLDIMLPKMNGMELLYELKSKPRLKKIPVIMLTNLGQEDVVREAFEIGCIGYIIKMRVTPKELVRIVQDYLKNPRKVMDLNQIIFD